MDDIQKDEEISAMSDAGVGGEAMTDLDSAEFSGEVTIEVIDDRPEADRVKPRAETKSTDSDDFGKEESAEELAEMGERTSKRIGRLRYEWNEERRAKEAATRIKDEAIRFAQQQQADNQRLQAVIQRGESVLVSEVRQRAKSDMARARDSYEGALSNGDPKEISSAQEAMNLAQIQLHEAEGYAPSLPAQQPGQPGQPGQAGQPGQPQQPQQPQQGWVPPQNPQVHPSQDPKLQKWMGDNDWFQSNSMMHGAAMGIHSDLVNIDGMNPTTDEYYTRLDSKLREAFPVFFKVASDGNGQDAGGQGAGGPVAARAPSVVASTSGRSGVGQKSPRTVQLTKSQVDTALAIGISPERYAKQLLKEQSNG